MDKEELVELFDRFINENGLWFEFKTWVESQGYSVSELGFPDDED